MGAFLRHAPPHGTIASGLRFSSFFCLGVVVPSKTLPPASWQLSPGVPAGTWDYFQSLEIAQTYDDFFGGNTLFEFDEAVLARHLARPGVVADLGCGTGRALLPLLRRGHRGVAVDLSQHMLDLVAAKAAEEDLPLECVKANLVEMDVIPSESVDYAICMFSTLAMIQGRENRRRALTHARRILRPGGLLVLHVHNLWYNVIHPLGRGWLVRTLIRAAVRRDVEAGDKFFDYRGVPNMFLHVFRLPELKRTLTEVGLKVVEVIPLDTARRHALPNPWLLGRLRANGWIVVSRKQ